MALAASQTLAALKSGSRTPRPVAPAAPTTPTWQQAAEQTAASSQQSTAEQTAANRPNEYTPWGSTTWEQGTRIDPITGKPVSDWSSTTTLDPLSQESLDSQQRLQLGRSQIGEGMLAGVQDELGTPMDWSGFTMMGGGIGGGEPYNKAAGDAIYGQWADRNLPLQKQAGDAVRTQLYNMGLREGDEGYERERTRLEQAQGDERQQASYAATIGAGAEAQRMQNMDLQSSTYDTQRRQQEITESLQKRGMSLNEINALISGQQVGMPEFNDFSPASSSQPTDYLGAQQAAYQAQLDSQNASQAKKQGMMSGIGSIALGGLAIF